MISVLWWWGYQCIGFEIRDRNFGHDSTSCWPNDWKKSFDASEHSLFSICKMGIKIVLNSQSSCEDNMCENTCKTMKHVQMLWGISFHPHADTLLDIIVFFALRNKHAGEKVPIYLAIRFMVKNRWSSFLVIESSRCVCLTYSDVFLRVPPQHDHLSSEKQHSIPPLCVLNGKLGSLKTLFC